MTSALRPFLHLLLCLSACTTACSQQKAQPETNPQPQTSAGSESDLTPMSTESSAFNSRFHEALAAEDAQALQQLKTEITTWTAKESLDGEQKAYGFHLLGEIAETTEDIPAAIDAYQQAIALNPSMALSMTNLGNLLMEQGRDKEALPLLARATELAPSNAIVWFNHAIALESQDLLEESVTAYRRSLELEPILLAMINLGVLLIPHAQAEAAEWFSKAEVQLTQDKVALSPEERLVYAFTIASGYRKTGHHAEALRILRPYADETLRSRHPSWMIVNEYALILHANQQTQMSIHIVKRACEARQATGCYLWGRMASTRAESSRAFRAYLTIEPEGQHARSVKAYLAQH